jgi:uncharacterized protein YeaO (DUF488 family)
VSLRIVRLGTPRSAHEGLRIGTVRRPPRGVRRTDFAKKNFYDVWLPLLAPSAPLVDLALHGDPRHFRRYVRGYLHEMHQPAPSRVLDMLAALSHSANFSVGCYCADESRCHRSLLRELLKQRGADIDEPRLQQRQLSRRRHRGVARGR